MRSDAVEGPIFADINSAAAPTANASASGESGSAARTTDTDM